MSDDILVRVEGVSKRFCRNLRRSLIYGVQDIAKDLMGRSIDPHSLRKDEFWASSDVSFELRRGECLGLIGRNGAGKTTLLKMLNGLIKPDRGRIEIRGRVGALIALGAGFNPILTGRENIYINGSVLGVSRKDITRKLDEIIEFAEVGDFIDSPVQSYSSGMQVRLGFAIATSMEPDLLLVDEVLAVGDIRFRHKAHQRMREIVRKGTSLIFVSHNIHEVAGNTDHCLWLQQGKVYERGASEKICSRYVAEFAEKAATASDFQYNPRRTGELMMRSVNVDGKLIQPGQVWDWNNRGSHVSIDIEFESKTDYRGILVHALNLCTATESYISRGVVRRDSLIRKGEVFTATFDVVLPRMLPGNYVMQYFVWPDGGSMLEGVFNLLSLSVSHESGETLLRSLGDHYQLSKMSDNSKGGLPLRIEERTEQ